MHPIIFEIGNFKVYSYGLMLALAFLTGGWYFTWAGKQKGIKADFIYELIIYVAIAAIIGGKLAYVLISW
ncbi:MAG TPA: prolipoprotein diacylglyceryl transferase, partial [Desulfotomaculum sp.]|nr:prolipoprotein diacylglyceryl transferase [Desulfotomaculum sp.]